MIKIVGNPFMEQTKIYTVVKVEVKDGCDAINLLIITTDKGKHKRDLKEGNIR